MHYVSINEIKQASKYRPAGYVEDVMGSGRIVEGRVELTDEVYQKLIQKYANPNQPIIKAGPGYLLSSIIHQITGKNSASCSVCSARAKQMNEGGWLWCWNNRDMILGWLCEEVQKLGHPVDKHVIYSLLKAAIFESLK